MKKIIILTTGVFIQTFLLRAQNVGIGTSNPLTPLHIKANYEVLRIQGFYPWIGFTNNTSDSTTYDGFVYFPDTSLVLGSRSGTNMPIILAPNNIPVLYAGSSNKVGIGTTSPTEKLSVNGNIDVSGLIKLSGSSGTTGQVLSSNGVAAPTWVASAYVNTARFGVNMSINNATGGGNLSVTSTLYNLNSDITIGSNSITINKSGLYHFNGNYDGWVNGTISIPVAPEFTISLVFTGGFSYTHSLENWKVLPTRTANQTYYLKNQFSQDFYITAPTTLQVSGIFNYSGSAGFTSSSMGLFGYRISD